jgi:hypothetical protein
MTGIRYAAFFTKQVVGQAALQTYLVDHTKAHVEGTVGAAMGKCVLDPAGGGGLGVTTTFGTDAIQNRRLNITGDYKCLTQSGKLVRVGDGTLDTDVEGSRTIVKYDPDWSALVPYSNQSSQTYYVYVGASEYPVDVSTGTDGNHGYSNYVGVPGFTVTPDGVDSASGYLKFTFDAALTALGMQRWYTTNTEDDDWSCDVAVWLDDSVAGVTVASGDPDVAIVYGAKLHMINSPGYGWIVSLSGFGDGNLGQATPSTTAAHYKVCILGPIVTNSTALQSSDDYVFIGSVASAVGSETVDVTAQPVVVPYANYTAGFGVEHTTAGGSDLGTHVSVTAPINSDLDVMTNSSSDQLVTVGNAGSGACDLVVEDSLRVDAVRGLTTANDIVVGFDDGAATRTLRVNNVGSGQYGEVEAGRIVSVKDNDGTGDMMAEGDFVYDTASKTTTEFVVIDAVSLFYRGDPGTGGGSFQYDSGGAEVNNCYISGSVTGTRTIMYPMDFPPNFILTAMALRAYKSGAGADVVSARLAFWDETASTRTAVISTLVASTASGAWSTTSVTLGSPYTVTAATGRKYYLEIEITNDGTTADTARFGRLTVEGIPARVQSLVA